MINESDVQCDESHSNTGCNRLANHLPSSLWDKPVIDSIEQGGVLSLSVFGKPYIQGLCNPVGCIASYIHFDMTSTLTESSSRF